MTESGPTDGVPVFWLATALLRKRRLVVSITAAGSLIALVVALLRPAIYTTSFSFLPQATSDQSQAGLASLAGQFGISLGAASGTEQSPEFYADLLATRRVLGAIAVDSVATGTNGTGRIPLSEFLGIDRSEPDVVVDKTILELREEVISTSVAKRTTGVATVGVSTRSPQVSLDIARRLIDELGEYNLRTRQSQAREERIFTEGRLEAARASLRTAEDELQRFLQANQRGESPALTFQRERLEREVRLREQVVMALAQRYEENRMREVRDTPVITVIETPVLAVRPDSRGRLLILVAGTAAAFGLALLVAVLTTMWNRGAGRAPDPALVQLKDEWSRLRRKPSS